MQGRKIVAPGPILLFIIGVVVAPLVFRTQADPDLWGHVRFGLDLLTTHKVPRIDPYSFTQDVSWINHEWLSELIMGAAYQLGGVVGLALLKGVLVLLIFFVVLGAYLDAAPLVVAGAFLVVAVGSGRVTATLRPQLWSLLAVAILCRLLIAERRQWWLMAVPAMFALWVNFHGGWIVGAAILGIWSVEQFRTDPSSRRFLVALAVLTALSTLVNPYGWRMWAFLTDTVRMSRPIADWQPLLTTPPAAWIPWSVVTIGLILTLFAKNRPSADRVAIGVLLCIASFRVERLSPFFIIATMILMSPTLRAQWSSSARSMEPASRRTAVVLGAACVALVVVSATLTARAASCVPISGDWVPDRVAGRALADARVKGKMVTWFDWGQYVIWYLSPPVRVSLDGRRETVYSDAVLRNHDEMDSGTADGLAYLQRLDPDYVWLPAPLTKVSDWLASHGYRIDVRTPRSFIAVRDDLPAVKVSTAPLSACFPGP